ncbi:putative transcription factor bZIP family [Lupinus albus]|uniref:Putative transcription factor bZIP family n=1 Tax=Lupinus albus TaxID=3870 RepID=A0A6A4NQS2_LUPAL|nr:putative transcription factor bZIP family [Lupinus albus]
MMNTKIFPVPTFFATKNLKLLQKHLYQRQNSRCKLWLEVSLQKVLLQRILSNRLSAQKSRLKKNAHVSDLESKAKYFEDHVGFLYRQITAQKNRNQMLQIEQHQLKLRMAACEKQRVLDEGVIEKNIAELERLKELHMRKLTAEAQAGPSRMLNMSGSVQIKSNSNLNQPPLGNFL